MGFAVSDTKTVIQASTQHIGDEVSLQLGRFGTQDACRNLGVDQGAHRRSTEVFQKALAKAKARVPRLKVLKEAGGQAWKGLQKVIVSLTEGREKPLPHLE